MTDSGVFRPVIIAFMSLFAHPLFGGVVLDGSFGTHGALPGPNFMIQANFGKQVGGNLFQSFNQFNLNSSQSATFTGPANVHNILARVTSGSPSSIDGTIRSDIPDANLFFMNPAGVLFGQHAQLDVSGSFAVTTANYLKLVGGGRFNANLGGGDVLTSAPVSDFGFLNAAPASVSIANATLSVAPGKSFSIVAGDITLDGTQLSAPGGNVSLFSARASGEVAYNPSDPGAHFRDSSLSAFGNITLEGVATVAIDSQLGGGKVTMRGGHLVVTESSTISSINQGVNLGGDIELTTDSLSVVKGGRIQAEAMSNGAGGNVSIQSNDIRVDGDDGSRYSAIRSIAQSGSGNAGSVAVQAGELRVAGGGQISSSTFGGGNGGNVTVMADSLQLDASSISAASEFGATGDAGSVAIDVTGAVNIVAGGAISTHTESAGRGGKINVKAGSVFIDSYESGVFTGIACDSLKRATGSAGDINLEVVGALVINDAAINAHTESTGAGGDVMIHAGSLIIDGSKHPTFFAGIAADATRGATGAAGNIDITVDGAFQMFSSDVKSSSYGGNGGYINIRANSLLVDNLAGAADNVTHAIQTAVYPGSTGRAGNIDVEVNGGLSVVNSGEISAQTYASGNAGNIVVRANDLKVTGGGTISAETSSSGFGGDLTIQAGSILIDGSAAPNSITGISIDSNSGATGAAGDLMINVDGAFTLLGSATITADTYSSGHGGGVTVHAGSLLIDGSAVKKFSTGISADAVEGTGNGGDISIVVGNLSIKGGGVISADTYSHGRGGDLTIQTGSLFVDGSGLDSFTGISTDSNAGATGRAGDLMVSVQGALTIGRGGLITADAYSSGRGGDLTIKSGSLFIDGSGSQFLTGISTDSNRGATGRAGDLLVQAGDLALTDRGEISSSTYGSGRGGSVNVTANSLFIDGSNTTFLTGISASAYDGSNGNAGNVTVHAGDLELIDGGQIQSATSAHGDGGNVEVTANSLLINGGVISASAYSSSNGNAGDVTVHIGDLELIDGGEIQSVTFAHGDGGNVNVTANSLFIDGSNASLLTGISASAGRGSHGNAGSVFVHAGDLELIDYGEIASATSAHGDGGNVDVTANSLLINGDGNSAFTTGILASAERGSSGNAGNMTVHAGNLELIDYGQIQSVTFAHGDGGNVDVRANSLLINGEGNSAIITGISANTEHGSRGNGGSVAVQADQVTIKDRGSISSSTFGFGHGGNVSIKADSLSIDGVHSGIFAAAEVGSIGRSGDVVVDANSLSLQSSGEISAASFTAAAAGSVQLSVGALTLASGSSISSANTGSGEAGSVVIFTSGPVTLKHDSSISTLSKISDAGSIDITSGGEIKLKDQSSITVSGGRSGGDITITAPDLVYLIDSLITATAGTERTSTGAGGKGGNITIDSQFIVLNNSLISADAAVGQGGNIKLVSDFFFNSNSSITATGTQSGTVNITAPELDLGAQLITLPTSLLSAESQLQERCTALLRGDFSSFISIGRGGTEPAPEELQETF